jgi:P4 family phage/plasmid primase-like protien
MTKPTALPVIFTNIPLSLKKVPRWVLWRFVELGEGEGKRWAKLPLQATGMAASSTNPATWTDFLSAEEAYATGAFDGVGFVFDGSDNLVGIDLDDCYDLEQGKLHGPHADLPAKVPGYCEISPTGTGVKIFTLGNMGASHVDHETGIEIYPRGRYFTVTGHTLGGAVPDTVVDLSALVPARSTMNPGDDFADYSAPVDSYDLARVETELLPYFDPNCGYTDWLKVGMALHHQFRGDFEALELWERWSYQDGNCPKHSHGACETKWATFQKRGGATLRSLIFTANRTKREESMRNGNIILPAGPLNHAREFLEAYYSSEEGTQLVYYTQDFFVYTGTHYEMVEEAVVRSQLYQFLDRCQKLGPKGEILKFAPTPQSVSAALDATRALVILADKQEVKPPVWLGDAAKDRPEASKLVSLENGLFHSEDSVLLPHTLKFFTKNSLPFAYDPAADCPTWERFLKDIWPEDQESIDCLQEIFGYILSGDTRQQKFFNVIGPRRSGKGTINKVLVALLGQHNTVAPELGELCDTFGLQPWLGKLLASFTDARAPERNRGAVVSQLLRIVGGDTVTVNRKNKEAWNGYLPTRIVIYSNEILQLSENSNALTGRMVVLRMTNSFYGKEDADLSNKLMAELPGIFNWSLEGLRRRVNRGGYFIQPKTGQELTEMMEEVSNPLGTFFDDVLVLEPAGFVLKEDVFTVYKKWCHNRNIVVGSSLAFKRKFLAATQHLPIKAKQRRTGAEDRAYVYEGVRFTNEAKKYLDSIDTGGTEF